MRDGDVVGLAELLCARLCHDLAGAIGAVGTGAELLADDGMDGASAAEALALLASSAAAATNRLRFLRLALGSGGAPVAETQLLDLSRAFLAGAGGAGLTVRLDWVGSGGGAWPVDAAKLLLNLVLLAQDCLPRGGVITVRARPEAQVLASLVAAGAGAVPGDAIAGLAAPGMAGLGPRSAQGYYSARLAARLGMAVRCTAEGGRVVLSAGEIRNSQE